MTKSNVYPSPPAGYQVPIRFEYPKIKLQIASIAVLFIVTPVLLFLTWFLQGQPTTFPLQISQIQDLVVVIVTLVITITVHELIHGLVYRSFGYQVKYGVSLHLFAAYAGAFGQWQKRNHNLIVALAPLVSLTVLLGPLLSIPNQSSMLIVFTALLFNIGGAVGDIYLTWRLLRLPQNALLYDMDEATMLIYRPIAAHQKP